jgi:hypothetical protein
MNLHPSQNQRRTCEKRHVLAAPHPGLLVILGSAM